MGEFEVKSVERVLDDEALLSTELLALGRWVAEYYCAPLGEVLRGMVPLRAEIRRRWVYRIAEAGRRVLYEGALRGASRRSRLSVDEQNREYAVLNYLESGEPAKPAALLAATGARKALLNGMVRKRWLQREPMTETRDARRLERVAVLVESSSPVPEEAQPAAERAQVERQTGRRLPKLNPNQLAAMAELAGAGGRQRVRDLQARLACAGIPESTLGTLVRRGLVRLEETPQSFRISGLTEAGGKRFAHEHALNESQTGALAEIALAMEREQFEPYLLFGVTGSGKTAVYVAAMQRALAAGRSALLLVPEIGLTPATAAELVAAFAGEVALLHSQLTPDERLEQWHRIRRG